MEKVAGISIKAYAAELGKPYAVVLQMAHDVGIEINRGRPVKLLSTAERKKIADGFKAKDPKPAKSKDKAAGK